MQKRIFSVFAATFVVCSFICSGSIVGEHLIKKATFNEYNVDVSCEDNYMTIYPFEIAVYGVEITNTGDIIDSYILDCPDIIDCCYFSSLNFYFS